MNIIKSKRKSKCFSCREMIASKYKVEVKFGYSSFKHYHLSCYLRILKNHLEKQKKYLKEFSKQKYRKIMILECLE